MTPTQVLVVSMLGGIVGAAALALAVVFAVLSFPVAERLYEQQQERRERRRYLRAVAALPTAPPREHQ
ncbi:hypothetical protein AB0G64_09325 [Streptomyces longwoodensis]|uniref:hypothetical protein n=1 Tax=Streptomyces longwoodensis TaxID=68231 RepID=UPI00340FB9DB